MSNETKTLIEQARSLSPEDRIALECGYGPGRRRTPLATHGRTIHMGFASVATHSALVRSTPDSCSAGARRKSLRWATSRHLALHSITSSARPRSIGGTSSPIAFAVLRFKVISRARAMRVRLYAQCADTAGASVVEA